MVGVSSQPPGIVSGLIARHGELLVGVSSQPPGIVSGLIARHGELLDGWCFEPTTTDCITADCTPWWVSTEWVCCQESWCPGNRFFAQLGHLRKSSRIKEVRTDIARRPFGPPVPSGKQRLPLCTSFVDLKYPLWKPTEGKLMTNYRPIQRTAQKSPSSKAKDGHSSPFLFPSAVRLWKARSIFFLHLHCLQVCRWGQELTPRTPFTRFCNVWPFVCLFVVFFQFWHLLFCILSEPDIVCRPWNILFTTRLEKKKKKKKKTFKTEDGARSLMTLQSNEANGIPLNAGIRLKSSCIPPINTVPHGGQVRVCETVTMGGEALSIEEEVSSALSHLFNYCKLPITVLRNFKGIVLLWNKFL